MAQPLYIPEIPQLSNTAALIEFIHDKKAMELLRDIEAARKTCNEERLKLTKAKALDSALNEAQTNRNRTKGVLKEAEATARAMMEDAEAQAREIADGAVDEIKAAKAKVKNDAGEVEQLTKDLKAGVAGLDKREKVLTERKAELDGMASDLDSRKADLDAQAERIARAKSVLDG